MGTVPPIQELSQVSSSQATKTETAVPQRRALRAARRLAEACQRLRFAPPVTHTYNPLQYAWKMHQRYLQSIGPQGVDVLFLGMNPGPWGMAQTGIPFGQVAAVRDWMGISAPIERPQGEHPRRPVLGLACPRSEVSGERLWGLMAARFGTAERFFQRHLVANYCPLVFMEASGRNRTPDKLPAEERAALTEACDAHLAELIDALEPRWGVGVGVFAETALRRVAGDRLRVTRILHPSPASPASNRDWAAQATAQLQAAGVWD
jgi:single-strand selective monofunctional uracil DNA glycosylase